MKKEKIHQRANDTLTLRFKYISPRCDISLPSLSDALWFSSCDAGSRLVAALLGSETLLPTSATETGSIWEKKKERKSSSFSFLLECLWHFQSCLAFKNNHFFFFFISKHPNNSTRCMIVDNTSEK